MNQQTTATAEEVKLLHVFEASRELVFNAWTDPEQLTKWFAPVGTYITYKQLEIKPGDFIIPVYMIRYMVNVGAKDNTSKLCSPKNLFIQSE